MDEMDISPSHSISMSCDNSCASAPSVQIPVSELNFLAVEHLRSQGLDVDHLSKQLQEQGRIQPPPSSLPTWFKRQNHSSSPNALPNFYTPPPNTLINHHENLRTQQDSASESRGLPNLVNQLIRVTSSHFPSLRFPAPFSVFHKSIWNPSSLSVREPLCFGKTPVQYVAHDNFKHRSLATPISHVVTNRELGHGISPVFQRVPCLYSNYRKLITIEGHFAAAYCVTFDKTGRRLFTASDDRTIKVWSVFNGTLLYCLRGHEGEISDISVDPHNRFLASGSYVHNQDSPVRIWSLGDDFGFNIKVLRAGLHAISVVAFSPSPLHKHLLVCDIKGRIVIWNYDNWDAEPKIFHRPYESDLDSNPNAAWSQSGTRFITEGGTNLCIWTVEQGLVVSIPIPTSDTFLVRHIQWCPYYNAFAIGSNDGSIMFYSCDSPQWEDAVNWQCTEISPRTTTRMRSDRIDGVTTMQFTSDGKYLVSASVTDNVITVWCTLTKSKLYEYAPHRHNVFTLLNHPKNPRLMITAGYDGLVTIVDVVAGKLLRAYMTNTAISDGSFSPSGDYFAFVSVEGSLTLFGSTSDANYINTPNSQFFASEQNPLQFDSNSFAVDAVLQVPSCQVPREIGDRLGRVYDDMPSVFLGPVPYQLENMCEEESIDYARQFRRVEANRRDIIEDGSKSDRVDILFPVVAEPSPEATPIQMDEPSSEEDLPDDDDDDWEGSSRIIHESSGAHTLQTRRRTYAAGQESEESESEGELELEETSRPRRTTRSERKYPDWVTTVKHIHNTYIPQVYDEVVYFVEGHQQYMDTYRERGTVIPTEEPYIRCRVEKVSHVPVNYRRYRTKVRFELTLQMLSDDPENEEPETFIVQYHPLSKCPDFVILASLFDYCSQQSYFGRRFRMFYPGNDVYYGRVINVGGQGSRFPDSPWESLQVEWEHSGDNDGHISCWEIELLPNQEPEQKKRELVEEMVWEEDDEELEEIGLTATDKDMDDDSESFIPLADYSSECDEPMEDEVSHSSPEGSSNRDKINLRNKETRAPDPPAVPPSPNEWLREDEKIAPERVTEIVTAIRKLFQYPETIEFREPIDLQSLPNYYTLILSAIDLTTIIRRLENGFYRREEAIVDDIRRLEDNALVFNGAGSWFYKVSHVIRVTLIQFIMYGEWTDPSFDGLEDGFDFSDESVDAPLEYDDTPEESNENERSLQSRSRRVPTRGTQRSREMYSDEEELSDSQLRQTRSSRPRRNSHKSRPIVDSDDEEMYISEPLQPRSSRPRRNIQRLHEDVTTPSSRPQRACRAQPIHEYDSDEEEEYISSILSASSSQRSTRKVQTVSDSFSYEEEEEVDISKPSRPQRATRNSLQERSEKIVSPQLVERPKSNRNRKSRTNSVSHEDSDEYGPSDSESVNTRSAPSSSKKYNIRRSKPVTRQVELFSDSDSDADVTPPRHITTDISNFCYRANRPSRKSKEQTAMKHKYPTRSRAESEPEQPLEEEESEEEREQLTVLTEAVKPAPKRRSLANLKYSNTKASANPPPVLNTKKNQETSPCISSEDENEPSEQQAEDSEEYNEGSESPKRQPSPDRVRRSNRKKSTSKLFAEEFEMNLRKRTRNHSTTPQGERRKSKRQRTKVKYNFDDEYV